MLNITFYITHYILFPYVKYHILHNTVHITYYKYYITYLEKCKREVHIILRFYSNSDYFKTFFLFCKSKAGLLQSNGTPWTAMWTKTGSLLKLFKKFSKSTPLAIITLSLFIYSSGF